MTQRLGMITIGQAPRVDVVPEMAELLGPDIEIVERGALDGLGAEEIDALAPGPDDQVLVTRLASGDSVFVAKRHITPRVQRKLDELDDEDVAMTVLLCTGRFEGLSARRPLVEPDKVLVGVLRGISVHGRLGVLTPSARHVAQTEARWRGYGFDVVVAPASPYQAPGGELGAAIRRFGDGDVGLVLMDCIGFRRAAREELRTALGVPVLVANLLVARVVAEMLGA